MLLLILTARAAKPSQPEDSLKLLISVEESTITAPYPLRLTLQIHNAGKEPLWLYRRVRSRAGEGSTLEAHLEPARAGGSAEIAAPAQGSVFESAGLPRPQLVRLGAEDDYTEKTTVRIVPALTGTGTSSRPIWGTYRLTAIYRARYSNAAEIGRNAGATLWQGEVTSNTIEIAVQPPTGGGSVSGSVLNREGRGLSGMLVSLADEQERLVDQALTDDEGRFSFAHLPLGVYWVTVRRPDSTEDTAVFRHIPLSAAEPAGSMEFVMYPPEIYEPQYLLHKPVLMRVTDSAGRPLDKVSYEATWSSGTVLDNVRGDTPADGIATLQLIPGRSFVTLRRRGCPKEEERLEVAPGEGVDGFTLVFECAEK